MNLRNSFNRFFHYALSVALLCVSQVACTASSLPPYEANYTTKMRGIRINSERQFVEIAEDTYRLSWSAKALWMKIKEWSEFKIVDDKVIPLSYNYTRKGLGSDRPIHVVFDWENMQAEGRKGDATTQFALEPGTLDKLSFQVQMQLDLLNSPDKTTFAFRIANHNGLRDYQFDYEADATIDTELGRFDTLIFKREKTDSTIRLWMSPQQYYLPVKVEQTGDDANTVVIKSWKSEERPIIESPEPNEFDADTNGTESDIGKEESDFDADQSTAPADSFDAPLSVRPTSNSVLLGSSTSDAPNAAQQTASVSELGTTNTNTEISTADSATTRTTSPSTNTSINTSINTSTNGSASTSENAAQKNAASEDIKCAKSA